VFYSVVVFNLGRGGVPQGRPVAGQLSGTPEGSESLAGRLARQLALP